jgi:regulator of replication initiation timing
MDTLEKLEERINKALAIIERLSEENKTIKVENDSLKKELTESCSKLAEFEAMESERSERIKGKLNNILEKLGTLEQM